MILRKLLIVVVLIAAASAQSKHAYLVYDAGCFTLSPGRDTKIVVRTKDDGTPDLTTAKIVNAHLSVVPSCGHYEMLPE